MLEETSKKVKEIRSLINKSKRRTTILGYIAPFGVGVLGGLAYLIGEYVGRREGVDTMLDEQLKIYENEIEARISNNQNN